MLNDTAQYILDTAGWLLKLFIPDKAGNFSFMEMVVALVLLIFFCLACWLVPYFFIKRKRRQKAANASHQARGYPSSRHASMSHTSSPHTPSPHTPSPHTPSPQAPSHKRAHEKTHKKTHGSHH